MRPLCLLATALTLATPAMAQQRAEFIDGTYVIAEGACEKLKALAAGSTPMISTVPFYVTADGFSFWEGGCGFASVTKSKDAWHVIAACEENGDEYTETYSFRRSSPDSFEVTLTTPGVSDEQATPLRYTRCDVGDIPEMSP